MLTAVINADGALAEVQLPQQLIAQDDAEAQEGSQPAENMNPLALEIHELAWGFGSFVVLALLMRFVLYPRLKQGTDARDQNIQRDHETAEQLTASARQDVANYEAQLATVRAEAAARVDVARQQLEVERTERLAQANVRIGERRTAASAEVDAAREAARGQVETAVAQVAGRAAELATGKAPDSAVVAEVVGDTVRAGAAR